MSNSELESLARFGRFIVQQWRDGLLRSHQMMAEGTLRSPPIQKLQQSLLALPPETRHLVAQIVERVVDNAVHDLLRAFQEAHDRNWSIEISVDGFNPAGISGMLHGEIQGPDGWIARFSEFKQHSAPTSNE